MPDSLALLPPITQIIAIGLFLYTAYWAFTIRRVIAPPLLRKQALWVGIVGAYFAGTFSYSGLFGVYNTTNALVNFLGSFLFFLGFIMIFAWVDATVRVARKSDPRLRDTLHWKRLRAFIWAGLIVVPITVFGLAVPLLATNQSPGGLELLPALLTIVAIMLSSGPALLLSGSRSKDATLRKHLKWFGLFVFLLFAAVITGFSLYLVRAQVIPIAGFVVGYAPFVAAAYCLYRSARSLVPIGHLPVSDKA
jgi:hypothetical protein